jgi:chromosome segregation ATPase
MGKVLALLLIILLALASVAGYLFLTEKITAGERQIADGQRQLEQGQSALEEGKAKLEAGKAKLEAGKGELAEGKKEYKQAKDNPFVVLADKLLQGGKGFKEAREQIAKGDKQVAKGDKQVVKGDKQAAKGEGQVTDGERRLDAGELELRRGREQLRLAKGARVACAVGAAFFASLSIVLGFCWRRSLARIFMHTDASQGGS